MAKIWNWTVVGVNRGDPHAFAVDLMTDPLPEGVNVFAFTYLTQVECVSIPADHPEATTVAKAWLRGFSTWDQNGNQKWTDLVANRTTMVNSWFIQNCAQVNAVLSVRSVEAISNITLIEWD